MSSSETNSVEKKCTLDDNTILEIGTILLTGIKNDGQDVRKEDYINCYNKLSELNKDTEQVKLKDMDDYKKEACVLLDKLECKFYQLLKPENIITSLSLNDELRGNANKKREALRQKYVEYLKRPFEDTLLKFREPFMEQADQMVENVYNILKDSTRSATIVVLHDGINAPFFTIVLSNMGITDTEIIEANSKVYYFALFFMLFTTFPIKSSHMVKFAEISKNIDTNIDLGKMNEVFDVMNNEKRAKLDARQYLTVNRFSKYRYRSIDKACFLFHGVGTGKTITSVSIALSHLTDKHLFNMSGKDDEGKEPLKIVIVAPQGLFRASFINDFKKLAIYTNNITINMLENGGQIESCNGYVKHTDDTFYKLEIIGYDYNSFFKDTSIVNMANATSVSVQITTATNDVSEDYKKMKYEDLKKYMKKNKIKIQSSSKGISQNKEYLIKLIVEHRIQNKLPIASPVDSNTSVGTPNKEKKSALDYLEDEKYDVLIMDEAHRLLTNKLKPEENYFGVSIDCANINDEADNLNSDKKYVNIKTIDEAVTIYDRESDSNFRIGKIVRRDKHIYTIEYEDGTTVEKLKSELTKLNNDLFIEHTDEENRIVLQQKVVLDIVVPYDHNSMLRKTVIVYNPSDSGVSDPHIRKGTVNSRDGDIYTIKYTDTLTKSDGIEKVEKNELLKLNTQLIMEDGNIVLPQAVKFKTKDPEYIKIRTTIKNDTESKLFREGDNRLFSYGTIKSFDTEKQKYNIVLEDSTIVQKTKEELIKYNTMLENSIKKVWGTIKSFDTEKQKYNIVLDNNTIVQKTKEELLNLKPDLHIEDSQEKEDRFVVGSKVMVDYSTTYTKGHRKNTFTDGRFLRFCEKFSQVILLTGTPFQSSESDIVDITYFLTNPKMNKSSFSKLCYDSKTSGGINNIFTTFKTNDTQGEAFIPTICKNMFHFLMSLPGADTGQYGGDGKSEEHTKEQNLEISHKAATIGLTTSTILTSFDKVIDNSISAIEMGKKTVKLFKNIQETIESANTLIKDFENSKDETKDIGENISDYVTSVLSRKNPKKQTNVINTDDSSELPSESNTNANNIVLANNNNIRLVCKIENLNSVNNNKDNEEDDNENEEDEKQQGGIGYGAIAAITTAVSALITYQYGRKIITNSFKGVVAYEAFALATTGRGWLVGLSQYFANANTYLPPNLRLAIARFGNNLDNIESIFGTMFSTADWKNSFKWVSIGIRVFSKIVIKILIDMYAYLQYAKNNYQSWIESFSGLIKEKVLSQVINYLTNEIKSVITAAMDKLTVLDVEQQAAIKAAMNAAWFSMVRTIFFDVLKFKKFDIDAIVKYTSPYISIYNYDHAQSAIDNTKMIDSLKQKNYKVNTKIIADGNTFAFPHKYVEQILVPFTREQEDKLINKKTNISNTDVKTAFRVGCGIYDIAEELNNGTSKDYYNDDEKQKLFNNYVNVNPNLLRSHIEMADKSIKDKRFDEVQLSEPYIQLDTFKRDWNSYKSASDSDKSASEKPIAININITNSFNMLDITPEGEPEKKWNGAIKHLTDLQKIIYENLKEYHKNNKTFSYDPDNKNLRFDNILLLLKIIRCGAIYQNRKYYLHPHYVKKPDSTYEYYLPLIYPTTEDIMYGFCEYLNKKNVNYIWMCNKFDKVKLDNNCNYGKYLTFPISAVDNKNPLCIIISPDHTEGFSFTFNPALFAPALCNTSGDEEQVYGRILRKYGRSGEYGNYNKKIYQYFGASLGDVQNLKYYAASYGVNNMNIWRDITYNTIPQNTIDISIKNNIFTNMVGQKLTSDIYHTVSKLGAEFYGKINLLLQNHNVQEAIEESKDKNSTDVTIISHGLFDKNGVINNTIQKDPYNPSSINPIISEEFQLSTIYNVKQLCKEYFSKLVNIENNNGKFIPFDLQFCDTELSDTLCSPNNKNNILCKESDLPKTDDPIYNTIIMKRITPIKPLQIETIKQLTQLDNETIENTIMPIINDYNELIKTLLNIEGGKSLTIEFDIAYFTWWATTENIQVLGDLLKGKDREMNIIARLSPNHTPTPEWLRIEIKNTYDSIYEKLFNGGFHFTQILKFYIKHKDFFKNLLYIYPTTSINYENTVRRYYERFFYLIDKYWRKGEIKGQKTQRKTHYEDFQRFVYPLIQDGNVFVIDKTNPFIDTTSSWYKSIIQTTAKGTQVIDAIASNTLASYAIPYLFSLNGATLFAYKGYLLGRHIINMDDIVNILTKQKKPDEMLAEFSNLDSEIKNFFPDYILECMNMDQYNNDNKTTITYTNSIYTGEVKVENGKQIRHGYGRQQWNDDDKSYYEGEFKNDNYEGKGTFEFYEFGGPYDAYELKWKYEGEWKNGQKNGRGIQTYYGHTQLRKYDGEWKDSKFHGFGKLFYNDGSLYEGNFEKDNADDNTGKARFTYKEGDYFLSKWKDGKPIIWDGKVLDYYDNTGEHATFNKKGWFSTKLPEVVGGKRKFTMKRKKRRTRKYKNKHNRKTKQAKYKQTKKYTSNM
jgi:hypothetical protein